jgi:VanZ family protein
MKKYLKFVLVVLWMAMIFYFSSKPAVVSDQESKLLIQIFQFLGLDLNSFLGELANFAVRKAAHFTEYFILCLLWFNLLYGKYELRKAALYSVAAVFLYACTDEFHQMFVPGRAARFTDVLIDTSGGSLAAVIRFLSLRRKGYQYEEE